MKPPSWGGYLTVFIITALVQPHALIGMSILMLVVIAFQYWRYTVKLNRRRRVMRQLQVNFRDTLTGFRADMQHQAYQMGHPYGTYGNFPP
jgi:Flp pilus assembly protein TadB